MEAAAQVRLLHRAVDAVAPGRHPEETADDAVPAAAGPTVAPLPVGQGDALGLLRATDDACDRGAEASVGPAVVRLLEEAVE